MTPSDALLVEKDAIPKCVGIIMDGNRRFAREKNITTLAGHRAGLKTLKEACGWVFDAGVHTLIVYAFSTENWKRSPQEVSYLMRLFSNACMNELKDLHKHGIRIRFIGERERMPKKSSLQVTNLEKDTDSDSDKTLVVAFSYGARAEITAAVNKLLSLNKTSITEEDIRGSMWSSSLPDPDLIIRTGGEQRLSNFLLFQAAYSELVFTKTFWPAFTKEEFNQILLLYAARNRRHGK